MKPSILPLLCSIASAHIAWQPQAPPMTHIAQIEPVRVTIISTIISLPPQVQVQTPTPTSTSKSSHWNIAASASHLLDELSEHLHIDLRKRQGGVGATAALPATTAAVQMPTITTYSLGQGAPAMVYTQTFQLPLEPWPAPQAGTVGMGTIQGQIGVVKSQSKREEPLQTAAPGQVLRIKGRGVTMS